MRESFDGRWELLLSRQDGTPPPPHRPALWGEMGGADRETGRKPLWGSIVLEMNRGAFFSAPLCGVKGGFQGGCGGHSSRTHTNPFTTSAAATLVRVYLHASLEVCHCCIGTDHTCFHPL